MKIDPKKIKELLSIMKKNQIKRLRYRIKDEEIELELPHQDTLPTFHHVPHASAHSPYPKSIAETEESEDGQGNYITSPLVGTFYNKPTPDSKSFVNVDANVTENSVVCIIEAMKVMNEVKADIKGKIVEILVEDGHPVEFGTKLFRVE
ncbi:MAG: Biotin carboxyl carrier protein of acetyl-CoA carboxylase [Chlamydiae bacterium]|nr:Biotin carboxyl carrier protein of acetyl-CoA carboxylase [Chlamydiota bacterium]